MKLQGPVTVEVKVGITDGKRAGVATVGLGYGTYPSERKMREAVATVERGDGIPTGWRVMTKREWWDQLCSDQFNHRFAMPGDPTEWD